MPGKGTREDVPPKALGGTVLTNTCARCNNALGSKIDKHLTMRVNHECFGFVTIPGVPGRRALGITTIREINGAPTVISEKNPPGEVLALMRQGVVAQFVAEPPSPVRSQLAVLKSAYLAACVAGRSILDTPTAHLIRVQLMAARELKSGDEPSAGVHVQMEAGTGEGNQSGTRLCWDEDGAAWISLGGVLRVRWPVPELVPVFQAPPPVGRPSQGLDSQ